MAKALSCILSFDPALASDSAILYPLDPFATGSAASKRPSPELVTFQFSSPADQPSMAGTRAYLTPSNTPSPACLASTPLGEATSMIRRVRCPQSLAILMQPVH